MKILHIVRDHDDKVFRTLLEEINRFKEIEQTLLMVQDGVYMKSENMHAFACADDVRARGIETSAELVEYARIIDMIFEHDRVITW